MSRSIKTPWKKFYDEEKDHLEYPDFSAYKLIEYTASKHLNNISSQLKYVGHILPAIYFRQSRSKNI